MSKNNIKILTIEEISYLKSRYMFEVNDDVVLVKIQNYNRVTAHSLEKPFSLNTKVRKIEITPEAVMIWNEHFKKAWSLFEVINAINILVTTYQVPEITEIAEQLVRGTAKIKLV